jgi:hypothetical protein
MKALRIILLVLIVIGLGLLVSQRLWMPALTATLTKNDAPYQIAEPQSKTLVTTTTTTTTTTSTQPTPKPVPQPTPTDSGVDITATIGPTCPVQQYPNTQQCADKPYQTTLVLASTQIGKNGGVLIKTDAQGHFSENLGPGTYTVRAQSSDPLPRLTPKEFTIVAHQRTAVSLMFDSGIR